MTKRRNSPKHASGPMDFMKAHRLIKTGNLLSLSEALDSGVSPNLSNRFSWTLLMLAALEGNVAIGNLLISRGADIDRTNNGGETALSLAIHKGHVPFAKILLNHGAAVDSLPHGHTMEEWMKMSSGLPQAKIEAILELMKKRRSN
jgi:ankyrin repeat protein